MSKLQDSDEMILVAVIMHHFRAVPHGKRESERVHRKRESERKRGKRGRTKKNKEEREDTNLEHSIEITTTEANEVDVEGGPHGVLVVVHGLRAVNHCPVARQPTELLVMLCGVLLPPGNLHGRGLEKEEVRVRKRK